EQESADASADDGSGLSAAGDLAGVEARALVERHGPILGEGQRFPPPSSQPSRSSMPLPWAPWAEPSATATSSVLSPNTFLTILAPSSVSMVATAPPPSTREPSLDATALPREAA